MKKNWPSGQPKGWSGGTGNLGKMPLHPMLSAHSVPMSFEIGRTVVPESRLADGERGAIMLSNSTIEPNGTGVSVSGGIFDVDAVRSVLLFFDRIDCPSNSMMQVGPTAPAGLEDWQGLQKTRVEMSGTVRSDIFQHMTLSAFNALDEREPGRWSLARSAQCASFSQSALAPDAAFRIKLQNALPIPDRSVPYEDILLFKERRRSELGALRHYIEELALEVSKSGFGGLAETVAFEKFQQALADHASVSRESNFLKRLATLEVSFQWDELAKNPSLLVAAGTAVTSVTSGLPILTAAWNALVAFAPLFSIESALGLRGKRKSASPFEYVIQAGEQL